MKVKLSDSKGLYYLVVVTGMFPHIKIWKSNSHLTELQRERLQ